MLYLWRWETDNERTAGKSKKVCVYSFLSFVLAPACAQWFHIYRAKPDLASTSCTYAGQVLFLSVKEKLGTTSVFLLFRRFGVSKLGRGGCRAGWKATSGSSVEFGDVRCCGSSFFLISCVVATFVPAGWSEETQGSYRNDLIITDTAVAEAPQSPDKIHILSVFRHVCYIIEWAGRKWKPVIAAEITYWLFSPISSLFLSSRSSSWCALPDRCSFICYIL